MMVTRIVTLTAVVSLLFAVGAMADPTVQVSFPEKGRYLYWFEFKDTGKQQATAPKHVSGKGAAIDLAPASPGGKLAAGELRIYNPKSGNVAAKSLENFAGKKELKLKDADFDRVGRVLLTLRPAEGKPEERVESAVVTLRDANSDEFTVVVDPSCEGVAEFRNIAAGQESITVAYDSGKTKKMTIDLEIPADRESVVFSDTLPIYGDVRTVKVAAPTNEAQPDGKPAPVKEKPKPSPAAWISAIAGIIFLGLVVFIGYVSLKSKGVTLESSLKKVGVQFPQDADAGTDAQTSPSTEPQVDPTVCQFCGQEKDSNGRCACSIDASPGAASSGVARLIGTQGQYSGRIFEITGSGTTIGRDVSNTFPLNEDGTTSRRHARIDKENGGYAITDEGSSNGTFVNGVKITGRQMLKPGDEVQIGSTKFRFEQ